MKCSLISLIDAPKLEFPLETCGNMDLQITDLQGLTPDNPPAQPDVLYTIEQNQLLRYQGTPARGPVLCIGHTGWTLRHSQASFPALILVLCPEPSRVYAALSRILFQEGVRASQMPEVSAAFLRCRSLDALIEQGYAYLGNPFAIHDSDGMLLAYSRQAGLRDDAWKSEAFLSTLSHFHSVEHAAAMEHARRDQVPVLLSTGDGPQQLRMALSSRGQTLGYLTVAAQFRPFSGTDPSGESLHTLEVYLSTGGKKARAAELLYIHLNTLKYRLSTLSSKLDANLDDPATMFALTHALHIVRYLRCFGDDK